MQLSTLVKKIFGLKSLLILCGLLLATYCGAYLHAQYYFRSYYSNNNDQAAGKFLIVWHKGLGEQETIARLKIAAKNMNWEARVVSIQPRFYLRWFVKNPVETAIKNFQPDFLLTIQDWVPYYYVQNQGGASLPNYLTLTMGTEHYLKQMADGDYDFVNPEHKKFDLVLPSFWDIDKLQAAVKKNTGQQYQGFYWYPVANATTYDPVEPEHLFYSGGVRWDPRRASKLYEEFFQKLDQQGYLRVCGPKHKWRHTPNSALGVIQIDGTSLIDAQHKAGISLLLHSQDHLDGGAPTGRIFEAAAANTVIISDPHPFVKMHFAENVLYINPQGDAEDIFKQIDEHMRWIKANPQQAKQMANNCHKIFLDKFTMEQQLAKLFAVHKSLTSTPA